MENDTCFVHKDKLECILQDFFAGATMHDPTKEVPIEEVIQLFHLEFPFDGEKYTVTKEKLDKFADNICQRSIGRLEWKLVMQGNVELYFDEETNDFFIGEFKGK